MNQEQTLRFLTEESWQIFWSQRIQVLGALLSAIRFLDAFAPSFQASKMLMVEDMPLFLQNADTDQGIECQFSCPKIVERILTLDILDAYRHIQASKLMVEDMWSPPGAPL